MNKEQSAEWNIFHAITCLLDFNGCMKNQIIILNKNGWQLVKLLAQAIDRNFVESETDEHEFIADGFNFKIIVK